MSHVRSHTRVHARIQFKIPGRSSHRDARLAKKSGSSVLMRLRLYNIPIASGAGLLASITSHLLHVLRFAHFATLVGF